MWKVHKTDDFDIGKYVKVRTRKNKNYHEIDKRKVKIYASALATIII